MCTLHCGPDANPVQANYNPSRAVWSGCCFSPQLCPGPLNQTNHHSQLGWREDQLVRRGGGTENPWSDTSAEKTGAEICWKDYGDQRSCLAAVCSKILFVRPLNWELWSNKKLVLEMNHPRVNSTGSWDIEQTIRSIQPDAGPCSCSSNDNHPTSREKAINCTKEQPGTQFSSFQLEHFHVHPKTKMRRRRMEGVHVTRRKVPFRSVAAFGELTRECLSRLGFTFGGTLRKAVTKKSGKFWTWFQLLRPRCQPGSPSVL